MDSPTPCPSDARWRDRLLGRLADSQAASLDQHLTHCPPCQETVRLLRAGGGVGDRTEQLASLLERWEAARAGGTNIPAEELCRDRPDLLADVRQLIGDANRLDRVFQPPKSDQTSVGDVPVATGLGPAQAADEIGRLGDYRVLRELGRGGMGAVFLAEDPRLRRKVALKVMLPRYAVSPTARERFLREARAAAAVEHDHIVPIFQVGEDLGTPFLAMPYLKGESLSDRLKRERALPVAEALRVAREVALGLAAAHREGLIHRDIKPANIWLEGETRRSKILDFGLARSVSADGDEQLTDAGAIVGTPAYMSPEQARQQPLDGRTDLFSLGAVLYQMFTGRQPFPGTNTMSVLTALAVDTPPSPHMLNPAVPPAASAFVMRLLSKDPAGRPASAHEAARTLADLLVAATVVPLAGLPNDTLVAPDPWAELDSDGAADPPAPPTVTAVIPASPRSGALRPPRPRRRRWPAVVALGVLATAAVAGLAMILIVLRTPRGLLVIESDDPNAELIVKRDGQVVRDRTRSRQIELKEGDYTVELADARAGVKLSDDRVTIEKDRRFVLRVRVERTVALPPPKGKATGATPADRKAVETLHQFVTLDLRLPSGEEPRIGPSDPLPAGPFELIGIIKYNDGAAVPPTLPGLTLAALAGQKSFASFSDSYQYVRWSEADFAKLAEMPARESLTNFYTGLDLTPRTVELLKRFPKLTNAGSILAGQADDALLVDFAALHRFQGGSLTVHDLGRSGKVTEKGWAALLDHPLTEFNARSPVGPEKAVCEQIARMPLLTSLALIGGELDDDGLRALSRCPKLTALYLWNAKLPPGGVKHLVSLSTLTQLALGNTSVTDDDIAHLSQMKSLRNLDLTSTAIQKPENIEKLRTALPRLELNWNSRTFEPLDRDWAVANWALTRPGGFQIRIQQAMGEAIAVGKVEDLPAGPFTLRSIQGPLTDDDMKRLAGLPALVEFAAGNDDLTDAGMRTVLAWKDTLTDLYVASRKPTDETARTVASLSGLTKLHLGGRITDDGLAALAGLQQLHMLSVPGTAVTDSGLKYLARLPALKALHLDNTSVSDAGVETLANLKSLNYINLTETRVTQAGFQRLQAALPKCKIDWADPFRAVAQWLLDRGGYTVTVRAGDGKDFKPDKAAELPAGPFLVTEVVHVSGDALTDADLRRVSRLPALKLLSLNAGRLTADGLRPLADLAGSLDTLHLNALGKIGDDGLKTVGRLTGLRWVVYKDAPLTAAGLAHLAGLRQLSRLDLSGCGLTDEVLESLGVLKSLREVNLGGTKVSAEGVRKLAATLPECRITWDGGVIGPTAR